MELAANAAWLMAPVRAAPGYASTNEELDDAYGKG